MEVNERRIKDASISLLTIGWRSSQSLASALRQAIFRIQYVNTLYGERSCHDYLKSTQGRRFKDEGTFARLAKQEGNGQMLRTAVSEEDVRFLHKTCSRYGVDYLLQSRPDHLEEWADKKFMRGEMLNDNEEKILSSFILLDSKGNMIEDPEKPGMPLLKDCSYMLTFKESDVDRWDMICTALEERHRGLKQRIDRAQQKQQIQQAKKQKQLQRRLEKREGLTK